MVPHMQQLYIEVGLGYKFFHYELVTLRSLPLVHHT